MNRKESEQKANDLHKPARVTRRRRSFLFDSLSEEDQDRICNIVDGWINLQGNGGVQ